TLIAFEWFARVGIDVGVIEVGLGGRLDATNLVRPAVTAITSIAFDHEAWLGHDLAAIAAEKAGILKAGVPLALGRLPEEAARVVLARAAEVGAPAARVGSDATLAEPPGVAGERRVVLVFALMADKDWRAMLGPLLERSARVIVTRVGRRAADPQALADALQGRVPALAVDDAPTALRAALSSAGPDEAVLVTGSLFLVGEAYAELGGRRALFEPWQPPGSGATEAAS